MEPKTGTERSHSHTPSGDRRTPVTTYRLQLSPEFTFSDAGEILDYLKDLGVTDVYFSPILQAAPGSTHGYDVVDHSAISKALGGRKAFEKVSKAIHDKGMHLVVDVVPNHMAVPTPLFHNKALWSVLRDGKDSSYINWFDIEPNESGDGVLMPVLGDRIGTVLAAGEITLDTMVVPGFEDDGEQPVLRYYDHVFPVRPGTESLPTIELLDRQFYRLAHWRVANEELNYRRFFDVDTLAAIRVEDPEVFDASHALLLELFNAGLIDSFRIDHPDGLADPRGYFRRLSEVTGGAWIVAEKILEGEEQLPGDWQCSGTTGYDALRRIQGLFTDPAGVPDLVQSYAEMSGEISSVGAMQLAAKRQIVTTSLFAEVDRLATLVAGVCHADVRLRDHTYRSIRDAIEELVVQMDRYRAYVVPGEKPAAEDERVLRDAQARAAKNLDEGRRESLDVVVDILLGNEIGSAGRTHEAARNEAIVRFQQVCGAVTAKGVEDTTFYRFTALLSTNEVGGGPTHPTYSPDSMHTWAAAIHKSWPSTMTTLSTHDTKRGEDTRAWVTALSEYSSAWVETVNDLRGLPIAERPSDLDGQIECLLWQTIAGTWTDDGPIEGDRLEGYLLKAAREQKSWTTWTEQATERESALVAYAYAILGNEEAAALFTAFHTMTASSARATILGAKTLAMTLVGVPDIYQGEEATQNSLVDPDNRRAVDYETLTRALVRLDGAGLGSSASLDDEKLWVTSRLARLRAENPWLAGAEAGYAALPVSTGHAFAFVRTRANEPELVTVVTRLAGGLEGAGGYGTHTVVLPEGTWHDEFTGKLYEGGAQELAVLLGRLPVAVLTKEKHD